MSALRLQPHATLLASVWKPTSWDITIGERTYPNGGFIEDFDYSLKFRIGYNVSVDMAAIQKQLGSSARASICAWAVADCPAGTVRLANSLSVPASGNVRVELVVPAGTVAGELEMTRGLAIAPQFPTKNEVGDTNRKIHVHAIKPGSRLLEDAPERIRLEGGWSRFPIEAGSFSQMGLEHAAWTVRVAYESVDDPFLGSVRLLINLEHPAGKSVISSLENPGNDLYLSVLRADIFRQLFHQLASDDRFCERREFEPESIGAVATGMAEDTLKNDLPTVLLMVTEAPAELDSLVQVRSQYLDWGN